jgi:hypothetical protein
MTPANEADSLRNDAQRLAIVIGVSTVVLWVLLILERLGAPAASLAQSGSDAGALREIARRLVMSVPDVADLAALYFVRVALKSFARGDFFAPVVTRMLERVGAMLAAGALASAFLVPLAERAIGAGPGYWIAFDVSALVLGAVGLALIVIARVLRRASAIESELAGIF